MQIIYKFIFLIGLFFSCSCWAESQFFPNTNDIPLMNGLVIQSTEEINFDTPIGQIINIEVLTKDIPLDHILSYYQNVLPEMGWEKVHENKFVREKDILTINVIQKKNPTKLRFEITLNNPRE